MTDKEQYLQEMPKVLEEWKRKADIYKQMDNQRANIFISDGIAHPEKWFEQKIRPLFVLKEAYDKSSNPKDWDEVKWFLTTKEESGEASGNKSGKISGKTWQTLCKWSSYLFENNYDIDPIWENENLRQIALINIKKYGGYEKSQDKDLRQHAERHWELIYKQIELIKPTIIICGYTGWLLDIVWQKKFNLPIRKKKIDREVYEIPRMKNVKLIDFWHPSAWSIKKNLADAFIENVRIAKKSSVNEDGNNESKDDN